MHCEFEPAPGFVHQVLRGRLLTVHSLHEGVDCILPRGDRAGLEYRGQPVGAELIENQSVRR